jgi:hypothetical protein
MILNVAEGLVSSTIPSSLQAKEAEMDAGKKTSLTEDF